MAIKNPTKIEWCDYTWNPVTGCKHGCYYCYAQRLSNRFGDKGFKPKFHPERLKEPGRLLKTSTIFVCSMGDMFGSWVPEKWRHATWRAAREAGWHRYIWLTKAAGVMAQWVWTHIETGHYFGFSVNDQESLDRRLEEWQQANAQRVPDVISVEPIHGPITFDRRMLPQWVIIGFESQRRAQSPAPQVEWVKALVDELKERRPVFVKNSVPGQWPKDYPWRRL